MEGLPSTIRRSEGSILRIELENAFNVQFSGAEGPRPIKVKWTEPLPISGSVGAFVIVNYGESDVEEVNYKLQNFGLNFRVRKFSL